MKYLSVHFGIILLLYRLFIGNYENIEGCISRETFHMKKTEVKGKNDRAGQEDREGEAEREDRATERVVLKTFFH